MTQSPGEWRELHQARLRHARAASGFSSQSFDGDDLLEIVRTPSGFASTLDGIASTAHVDALERSLAEMIGENASQAQRQRLATTLLFDIGSGELRVLASARVAIRVGRLPIVRGQLDIVASEPLVSAAMTATLRFALVSIPGYGDLIRENHNFGYHYHYSDDGLRRADILLTFSRTELSRSHPAVTWEPHAVRKADFQARVNAWASDKRLSVQAACQADRRGRSLDDYVPPGKTHALLLVESA